MSGLPVSYGRNIVTSPVGSGVTADSVSIVNSVLGPTNEGLNYSGVASSTTALVVTPSTAQNIFFSGAVAQSVVLDSAYRFVAGKNYRIGSNTTSVTMYTADTSVLIAVTLAAATLFLLSTSLLAASGSVLAVSSATGLQTISYTGKTEVATTIAAGSNGVLLPANVINVASTTGLVPAQTTTITVGGLDITTVSRIHVASNALFATSGTVLATTGAGEQLVSYTGKTSATATTLTVGSNGAILPQPIIYAASVATYPTSGEIAVATGSGVEAVAYTGTRNFSTTIAAGSNGVVLPFVGGTLNVASSAAFPTSGTILVTSSLGPQVITYTSKPTGTSFGGCNGGSGTLSTGGAVNMITFTGCTGGTGTMSTGGAITGVYFSGCTTSGSGLLTLSGLVSSPGAVVVQTSTGTPQIVTYTGPNTATTITGCTGGTGTMSTGGAVTQHRLTGCSGGTGTLAVGSVVFRSTSVLLTAPALFQGELVVADTTGVGGLNGWSGFLHGGMVMDNLATPTFPQDLNQGVWYGSGTKANSFDSTCITLGSNVTGQTVRTTGPNCIAVCGQTTSTTPGQIVIGNVGLVSGSSPVNGFAGIALGGQNQAINSDSGGSISMGAGAQATGASSIAIAGASSTGARSIYIGPSGSTGADAICVAHRGIACSALGVGSCGGGRASTANGLYSIGIGDGCASTGQYSIRLITGSTSGDFTIGCTIGGLSGRNSIAIGSSIYGGSAVLNGVDNGIAMGTDNTLNSHMPAVVTVATDAFKIFAGDSLVAQGKNIFLNGITRTIEQQYSFNANVSANTISPTITSAQAQTLTGVGPITQLLTLPSSGTVFNGFNLTLKNQNTSTSIRPARVKTSVTATIVTYTDSAPSTIIRTASVAGFSSTGRILVDDNRLFSYTSLRNNTTTTTYPLTLPSATIDVASTSAFDASGTVLITTTLGKELVTYTAKLSASTTVSAGSNGVDLGTNPPIIYAASTVGFAASGIILITGNRRVNYTGVSQNSTTIAAGSNGVALPTGTINVVSTTGFAASGTILVTTSLGVQLVSYTGTTATTFTGCTGGTGTMSTGGAVTFIAFTGCTTAETGLIATGNAIAQIQFTGCTGGTGVMSSGALVEQIGFYGCTNVGAPCTVTYNESVTPVLLLSPAQTEQTIECIDTAGGGNGTPALTTPMNGWVSVPKQFKTAVSALIPVVVVPNNYNASLKGVPIGGVYRSGVNGSTTPTTFAITATIAISTDQLVVTSTAGTIERGQVVSGGGTTANTVVLMQLSGTPGGNGTYRVSIVQVAARTPDTISSSATVGDALYVRTA